MPLDWDTAVAHLTYFWDDVNDRLSNIPPVVLIGGTVVTVYSYQKLRTIYRRSDRPLHKRFFGYAMHLSRKIPYVEAKIQKELEGHKSEIVQSIHKFDADRIFIKELPADGLSSQEIIAKAEEYSNMGTFDIDNGRVSGTVYTSHNPEHIDVMKEIFVRYAYTNPLHPDIFPGVRKMEAEIVRIVANMYNGPAEACGTVTSGGTESIMLACYAYRTLALSKGISEPTMLVPLTAHAAFDKAADYFNIRIIHIPVDKDNRVNLREMRRQITGDTCLLVGSAPNFPSGTIDDIMGIAQIGQIYGIPVHVDACLGGFIVPFLEEAGFALPLFDFRLPGVTSISADTHKYGYSPKGTSVVMYRSPEYLHNQYYSISDWAGGIYATPTFAGSRSGLAIALTWASLLFIGRKEYVNRARAIVSAARQLANEISTIEGLSLHGSPDASVVAFKSDVFNIYAVGDILNHRGWNLNTLQNPSSIHFCLTHNQAKDEVISQFVADLRSACKEVLSLPDKGGKSKTAAIYGTATTIPDLTLVSSMTHVFLDACYATPERVVPGPDINNHTE